MRRAGLWSTYTQTLVHRNIAYGPWEHSAWFGLLVDEAASLAKLLKENDPLLVRVWPLILQDRGEDGLADEESGATARCKFIAELTQSNTACVKGPKASTKRWWSWMKAHSTWGAEHHTRFLCLASLAIRRGWASSWEELFAPLAAVSWSDVSVAAATSSSAAAAAAEPAVSVAAADSSSAAAAAAEPAPPAASHKASLSKGSQAKDTQHAKAQLQKLRERCQNKLHAATRYMGDLEMTYNARIIGIVGSAGVPGLAPQLFEGSPEPPGPPRPLK